MPNQDQVFYKETFVKPESMGCYPQNNGKQEIDASCRRTNQGNFYVLFFLLDKEKNKISPETL